MGATRRCEWPHFFPRLPPLALHGLLPLRLLRYLRPPTVRALMMMLRRAFRFSQAAGLVDMPPRLPGVLLLVPASATMHRIPHLFHKTAMNARAIMTVTVAAVPHRPKMTHPIHAPGMPSPVNELRLPPRRLARSRMRPASLPRCAAIFSFDHFFCNNGSLPLDEVVRSHRDRHVLDVASLMTPSRR